MSQPGNGRQGSQRRYQYSTRNPQYDPRYVGQALYSQGEQDTTHRGLTTPGSNYTYSVQAYQQQQGGHRQQESPYESQGLQYTPNETTETATGAAGHFHQWHQEALSPYEAGGPFHEQCYTEVPQYATGPTGEANPWPYSDHFVSGSHSAWAAADSTHAFSYHQHSGPAERHSGANGGAAPQPRCDGPEEKDDSSGHWADGGNTQMGSTETWARPSAYGQGVGVEGQEWQGEGSAAGRPRSRTSSAATETGALSGTSDGGRRWACPRPECALKKGFKRHADLMRHGQTVHRSDGMPKFSCRRRNCARKGDNGFTRQDHLTGHLRNFHMQHIPKRGGQARQAL